LIEASSVTSATGLLRLIATILFALALPVFLVTSAVRTVALSESFYMHEFEKNRTNQVVPLSDTDLRRVAEAFISYFQTRPGRLDPGVRIGQAPLFNEREIQHMVDVQALMRTVFLATWIALGILAAAAVAIVAAHPPTGVPSLLRAIAGGGVLTVAVILMIGLLSLLDFSQIFTLFHHMSFTNDLWLLDPRTDRLIQLFPLPFFYDAAMQIALRSAGLGAAMAAVAILGLRILQ
jgi:integral membrane protein (TIGR01906 family)